MSLLKSSRRISRASAAAMETFLQGGGGGKGGAGGAQLLGAPAAPAPSATGRLLSVGATGKGGKGKASGKEPPLEVAVVRVPYSEHSSFTELQQCLQFLAPASSSCKVIPTVNCRSAEDARAMLALLRGGKG